MTGVSFAGGRTVLAMTEFNPLAGSILGSAAAQHTVDVEKQRQVRREQALRKNVALQDDQLEHQVESSDQVASVDDEEHQPSQERRQNPKRNRRSTDDGPPHIDVKA